MPTLADLLQARSRDAREAQLLAALNTPGFPITDWLVGSVARTMLKMITTGLVDFDALVPQIASGGFLGPFSVGGRVYPTRDWLELIATDQYETVPAPATFTRQQINLWCTVGAGSYVIAVGQLTAKSSNGNLYTNVTGGTVPFGTSTPTKLALVFQAESPGATFNRDGPGGITVLVTPLPGLIINNELLDFGGLNAAGRAARNGTGTGTVTPQQTVPGVSPTGLRTFTLTITVAGQVSAAVGSLAIDDGSGAPITVVPISPIPASFVVGQGVTLVFANGGQNPSFIAGDVYTFQTPGSPIVNAGTDEEADDPLRARCRGRWPALGAVPTEDRHIGWIRQASIDSGFGITKISASPSVTVAGQVDILVATDAGAVPGGVVAQLQTYVDNREGISDLSNVASAAVDSVTAAGTAIIRIGTATATKLRAKTNWQEYLAALPIGGDRPEGVVRLAALEQAIMDAGAVDVSGLTLNGSAANLALTTDKIAVGVFTTDPDNVWLDITWLEVP